jgi:hypothetical protein
LVVGSLFGLNKTRLAKWLKLSGLHKTVGQSHFCSSVLKLCMMGMMGTVVLNGVWCFLF